VACANDRCDQENVIEQLKNGVNALRVPLYDLVSNWAYMLIAALACNIKSWFAMMLHRKQDRRDWINMAFRRFTTQAILIPAMIIRRARTITVGIIGYHWALDRFLSDSADTAPRRTRLPTPVTRHHQHPPGSWRPSVPNPHTRAVPACHHTRITYGKKANSADPRPLTNS
jgi:hypothetical protein